MCSPSASVLEQRWWVSQVGGAVLCPSPPTTTMQALPSSSSTLPRRRLHRPFLCPPLPLVLLLPLLLPPLPFPAGPRIASAHIAFVYVAAPEGAGHHGLVFTVLKNLANQTLLASSFGDGALADEKVFSKHFNTMESAANWPDKTVKVAWESLPSARTISHEGRYATIYGNPACAGTLFGCFEVMRQRGDHGRKFASACTEEEMACVHSEPPLQTIRRAAEVIRAKGSNSCVWGPQETRA